MKFTGRLSKREPSPDRRGFLKIFVGDVLRGMDEFKGVAHCDLNDLPNIPPAVLREIIPAVSPGAAIALAEGHVTMIRQVKDESTQTVLFPATSRHLACWNAMNGEHTLGEIADHLAEAESLSPEEAMAAVREFFLALVDQGAVIPVNPVREP